MRTLIAFARANNVNIRGFAVGRLPNVVLELRELEHLKIMQLFISVELQTYF